MCCVLPSIPPMWRTVGDHRFWTRTGTQSSKPSTGASMGAELEKVVLQVRGNEQGSQRSPPELEQQGPHPYGK